MSKIIKIYKPNEIITVDGVDYSGRPVPYLTKDNCHFLQRLYERASIDMLIYQVDEIEELIENIVKFGEVVQDKGDEFVYRYKLAGRTIYPVINPFCKYIKTILGKEMLRARN